MRFATVRSNLRLLRSEQGQIAYIFPDSSRLPNLADVLPQLRILLQATCCWGAVGSRRWSQQDEAGSRGY